MKTPWVWDYEESVTKYYMIYRLDNDRVITIDAPRTDENDKTIKVLVGLLNALGDE